MQASKKPFTAQELYEFYLVWIDSPDGTDAFGRSMEPYTLAEFRKLLPRR